MARPRSVRGSPRLSRSPRLDPARLRSRRRSRGRGRSPMNPETPHTAALLLRDGVIMLGAAMAFVMLFRRFGLGAVLGYLVAGALVGPDGLGLVSSAEQMLHVAGFGIVLLLFLVGLELHPNRLWRLKHDIFGLGFLQVAVSGIALTILIHYAANLSWAAATAIGLPLAL